jgi:hypothetical protein
MQRIQDAVREVVYAVLPITAVVIVLQFTFIWLPLEVFFQFLVGVVLVSAGLIFFLFGVHHGMLPVGEYIGAALPKTGKLWLVVVFGILLGFVVTIAEPDVRVLATQVDFVSGGAVSKNLLIFAVALGVAIFRRPCNAPHYYGDTYNIHPGCGVRVNICPCSFYSPSFCADFI